MDICGKSGNMKNVEYLIKIVKEASELIKEDFEVNNKDDKGDLVTTYDYEIEKYLINKLNEAYPTYDIVSEEFNTHNKITDNCFVIDPIDGTINFANGNPIWAIMVCMYHNGEACSSVIYAPKLNELYYADETGAYLNDEKISVKELPIDRCLYSIDCGQKDNTIKKINEYTRHYRFYACAGISYAYIASGRLSGYLFRKENPWDYAAGMFLAKQAGAYTHDEEGLHIAACSKELLEVLEQNGRIEEDEE